MPDFFHFTPGKETSRAARRQAADASPLLGRFRAVPRTRDALRTHAQDQLGLLGAPGNRGSVHVGYGALVAAGLQAEEQRSGRNDEDDDSSDEDGGGGANLLCRQRRFWSRACKRLNDLWISPRQTAVNRALDTWWGRWGNLVFLPAGLVCVLFTVLLQSFSCRNSVASSCVHSRQLLSSVARRNKLVHHSLTLWAGDSVVCNSLSTISVGP